MKEFESLQRPCHVIEIYFLQRHAKQSDRERNNVHKVHKSRNKLF